MQDQLLSQLNSESTATRSTLSELEVERDQFRSEAVTATSQLTSTQLALQQQCSQLNEAKVAAQQAQQALLEAQSHLSSLEQQVSGLRSELHVRVSEAEQCLSKLLLAEAAQSQLAAELRQAQSDLQGALQAASTEQARADSLSSQVAQRESQFAELAHELSQSLQHRQRAADLEDELIKIKACQAEADQAHSATLNELRSVVTSLQEQMQAAIVQTSAAVDEKACLRARVSELTEQLAVQQLSVQTATAHGRAGWERVEGLQAQLEQAQAQAQPFMVEIASLEAVIEKLNIQVGRLASALLQGVSG